MNRVFNCNDRETWPSDWLTEFCEPNDERLIEYKNRFRQEYSSIRCYHGARPLDIETYYSQGIRLADHQELVSRAKSIFCDSRFPELSAELVEAAAAEQGCVDNQRLYLVLNDRELVRWSGHYVLYGSEFVCGIAVSLSSSGDPKYRRHLKTIGTPTVFKLNVPVDLVSDCDLCALSAEIGGLIRDNDEGGCTNFALSIGKSVPASAVIGHYHPKEVLDPLEGGRVVRLGC